MCRNAAMSPKFSIIIPVYNVVPYLRECLDSVLAQTITDWEAICVDDGSTDGCGAILDEYALKDRRFRIIHQKNAGVSAARNAALEVASGAWIGFVDSDDVIEDAWLKEVLGTINRNPECSVVKTGWTNWLADKKVRRDQVDVEPNLWMLIARCSFSVSTFYLREAFKNLRYPVGIRIREDALFLFEIASQNPKYALSPARGYCYRIRNDSASQTRRLRTDTYRLLGKYLTVWRRLTSRQRKNCCEASTFWIKKDVREWFEQCEDKTLYAKIRVWISVWRLVFAGGFNPFLKDKCGRLSGVRWMLYLLIPCYDFIFHVLRRG